MQAIGILILCGSLLLALPVTGEEIYLYWDGDDIVGVFGVMHCHGTDTFTGPGKNICFRSISEYCIL